jgi:hypothetical protein
LFTTKAHATNLWGRAFSSSQMLVELPFTVMRHASIPCTDPELNRIRKQLACVTPGGMGSRFTFVQEPSRKPPCDRQCAVDRQGMRDGHASLRTSAFQSSCDCPRGGGGKSKKRERG